MAMTKVSGKVRNAELDSLTDAIVRKYEAIRALFALAEGYSLIPLPAKKAAGQVVKAVLDKYGKALVSENYASESAHIESLL